MRPEEPREGGAHTTPTAIETVSANDNEKNASIDVADQGFRPGTEDQNDVEKAIKCQANEENPTNLHSTTSSILHRKDDDVEYPEGGLEAWLCVLGSWCGFVSSIGIANTLGSFQAYLSANQLKDYSDGTIGWIFSIYGFLAFFCGIYVGPIFDMYGPRWMVATGSVFMILDMFLLAVCTKYWHFFLVFGVLGGVGTSLLFTPSVAAIGHFFKEKRGNATGIAATGGAFGGIIFPLILQHLIPSVGFAWATRCIGFIYIFLCIIANLLIKSRLPPAKNGSINPDPRILKDPAFAVTVFGVFLLEFALFIPLTYISSYALYKGFSEDFSYIILTILNVGSVLGRWLPGLFADLCGRFNAAITSIILTVIAVFGIWLPAGGSTAGIVIFALMFGFASGSNISLTPVCVGQLCHTENYGRYYATCYTIVSIGSLTGIPIAGQIISANNGAYWGLIVFTGMCYTGALIAFLTARVMATGPKFLAKF